MHGCLRGLRSKSSYSYVPVTGGGFVTGFLTATGGGCWCMPVIVHTME